MELLEEVVRVLTPVELRNLRRLAGWTLRRLSKEAHISVTQISQFETGQNGLRLDQVKTCEKLLLRAAAERSQAISALFDKRYSTDSIEVAS